VNRETSNVLEKERSGHGWTVKRTFNRGLKPRLLSRAPTSAATSAKRSRRCGVGSRSLPALPRPLSNRDAPRRRQKIPALREVLTAARCTSSASFHRERATPPPQTRVYF